MPRVTFDEICYVLLSMGLDTPRDTGDFTFPARSGAPSPLFWELWNADKDGMKAWGFRLFRADPGDWRVSFSFDIPFFYLSPRLDAMGFTSDAGEKNKPYFCTKCKRKHYRGKIYGEHAKLAKGVDEG